MDFNEIIKADREGILSNYTISDLYEMRKICAIHLQNHNQFMVHPCESVESEIRRRKAVEAAESSALTAQKRHVEALAGNRKSRSLQIVAISVALLIPVLVYFVFPVFRANKSNQPPSLPGTNSQPTNAMPLSQPAFK